MPIVLEYSHREATDMQLAPYLLVGVHGDISVLRSVFGRLLNHANKINTILDFQAKTRICFCQGRYPQLDTPDPARSRVRVSDPRGRVVRVRSPNVAIIRLLYGRQRRRQPALPCGLRWRRLPILVQRRTLGVINN